MIVRRVMAVAFLALVAAVLVGCGTAGPATGRHPTLQPTHYPPLPPGVVVAKGHGWDSHGLYGPMPAAGTCHLRKAADGEPLPDPACTPGAVDSAVTDANIGSTVCRKGGYTKSVRPPVGLTDAAKRQLMAAYGFKDSPANYELDHLITLNDGGASDVRNLWPEPNRDLGKYKRGTYIHNDKDEVEGTTYQAICAGKVAVTAVQALMASDWTAAIARFGLTPGPGVSE